jgi:hypothetical protein
MLLSAITTKLGKEVGKQRGDQQHTTGDGTLRLFHVVLHMVAEGEMVTDLQLQTVYCIQTIYVINQKLLSTVLRQQTAAVWWYF